TTRYHNGDEPDRLAEVGKVADARGRTAFPHVQEMEILEAGAETFTVPVGRYPANAFGLHDMHGNVWEWCSDWHDDNYYARSPLEDRQGPEQGVVRVRRGGGWNTFPLFARSAFRNWHVEPSRCLNLGFRVVREVKAADGRTAGRPAGLAQDSLLA